MQASSKLGYESRGTLAALESGAGSLPIEKIHPIADIYQIPFNELIEKIRLYEPDLYAKYMALWDQITGYLSKKVIGLERHHSPFPSVLASIGEEMPMSDNVRYCNQRGGVRMRDILYIMSTGKCPATPEHLYQDPNQILLFPLYQLTDSQEVFH